MKKLLTIFLILCAAISRAQYPITQNLGSDSTLITVGRNSMGALKGGIIPMSFTDTTAANLTRIKLYGGALIWTTSDSSLWVRNKLVGNTNNSGTQYWFKIGGAGGGATGSFWNLTGNTIAAVPAGFGIGTNSADNLPFKTDNTTRLILPSTGLARQSGGAWKSMMFDTTNFTWGYGDGTNIYNSDGTLSANRTVTTDGYDFHIVTNDTNYVSFTPSTQTFKVGLKNSTIKTYFELDAGNGFYAYSKDTATNTGQGGLLVATNTESNVEFQMGANIIGIENKLVGAADQFINRLVSYWTTENPHIGISIDSSGGTRIGKGIAANQPLLIRGLRVLPNWQVYLDSVDAGGTANDSVLVVQSDGKVVRRNASAFSGGSYTASNGLTLSGSNFKLGGTLGENTTITQDGFTLGISDLLNFADTTNWKPVVVNTTGSGATAGTLRKATYWPVGSGGGGSPAGNFGNLQINRNGAFATPGSDSLDYENGTGLSVNNAATFNDGGAAVDFRVESDTKTHALFVDGTKNEVYVASNTDNGAYDFQVNGTAYITGTGSYLGYRSNFGEYLQVSGTDMFIGNVTGLGTYNIMSASQTYGIKFRDNAGRLPFTFEFDNGTNPRFVPDARIEQNQGADVASVAGAITLGGDGNVFEITGTSAITLISNTGWRNGATVTLLFTSTATLTDGTANSGTNIGMELAGNANFNATADDVLTLVLSEIGGTQRWREVSRSVN